MKKLLTPFLILLTILSYGQELIWSETIEVADGYGNQRPRLALTGENEPVVVWGTNGSEPVYVARWNGSAFDTPLAVSPEGLDPYCTTWTGPAIAASGDNVWVVFDGDIEGEFRVYTVKSTDGGSTFSDTVNVGGYSGHTRFTSIDVSPAGDPVVAFMENAYTHPHYVVANSPDGGATWNEYVDGSTSITGNDVCECCPPGIVTDGMHQVLMFRNNADNLRDLWATVSNDGGATFTQGSDVDQGNWVLTSCPSIGPSGFIRGDSVFMVWITGGFGPPNKVALTGVSKLTSMGRNNQLVNPTNTANQNYPRIHGDEQVLGIVYQETVGGNTDCYLAYSTDGTTRLGHTNVLINDVTESSQYNPDVRYADGVFHFTWQDNLTGNVMYRTAMIDQVGIAEQSQISMKVYPNPVSHTLYISMENKIIPEQIMVLDQHQRTVREINPASGSGEYSIDLSDLATGTYVVVVQADRRYSRTLFVKSE